jgi:multidrug resistance efflux pump
VPGSCAWSSYALGLSITQPLLAGAGRRIVLEPLTQAERRVIYAVRDYEIFRRDFAVDVARRVYELLQQADQLSNEEANFQRLVSLRERNEALAEAGRQTDVQVDQARQDELSSRNRLIVAQQRLAASLVREQKILIEFTIPRERAELKAALEQAQRELERVRLQADARLVDFKADRETNQAKLDLERETLVKLERQIEQAKIRAPRRGMVVYSQGGDGGGGRRFGNSEPIAEGTSVRERQELITIPSTGGMTAQASLHESVLKQVRPGQAVIVKVEALPNQTFHGQVEYVAVLPDQQSCPSRDLADHSVAQRLTDAPPEWQPTG